MQSTDSYERFIALAEALESAEIKAPPAWEGERCCDGCPGWGVFDIGARAPGVEIERCDCCDRFATDEEADEPACAAEAAS